jgi:hypothetical protein
MYPTRHVLLGISYNPMCPRFHNSGLPLPWVTNRLLLIDFSSLPLGNFDPTLRVPTLD